MRIDSHQHFWNYNAKEFSWIDNSMPVLKKDFLPTDLKKEISSIGFSGSIVVQARQNLDETKWLLSLADEYEHIKGVVGWVDLCSPEIDKQLKGFSIHPKLVGVRHVVQDEPDDKFLLQESFLKGISILSKYKLVYELLLYPKHLSVAAELVKMFPDQTFVLDHIAKPNIREKALSPWKEAITRLAKYPNVFCKLSGMVTESDWKLWQKEDFYPYLHVVFDAFGSERLMIGSDWPVCTLAGSYADVMGIVFDFISKYNSRQQASILGENAMKIYNLVV